MGDIAAIDDAAAGGAGFTVARRGEVAPLRVANQRRKGLMNSMNGPFNGRGGALAAVVGLGTALVAGGCAVPGPVANSFNPPPPGSTFTRAENNTGSFGKGRRELKVTIGERTWKGVDVVAFASAQGAGLYDKNGRLVAILNPADKPVVTWDPPDGGHGFRFPLTVGKTWDESARMTMPNGKVLPHENSCRVEGREEVTVPAGTFMTFKVRCTSPRGLEMTSWYAPDPGLIVKQIQKRSENNPFGGAGSREEQIVSIEPKR